MNTEITELLSKIAYIGDSDIEGDRGNIYYSKLDGAYIGRVGGEGNLEFLTTFGVTEEIQGGIYKGEGPGTVCLGFNPVKKEWYGWSHRAIFGFGIGSKCKKGSCGFFPSNEEEFIERCISFWGDTEYAVNGEIHHEKVKGGIEVNYIYNNEVPNEKLRGTRYSKICLYPKVWGKGEWTATTLEEAKQMAIDFARSVS